MPKQVSALNTFYLLEYINKFHPNVGIENLLNEIIENTEYYIENLKTGKVELIQIIHLTNTDYWVSNKFMIDLYNAIQARIPDPFLAYKMGKNFYKTRNMLLTAVGVPLIGLRGVLKRAVKENSKYNRTKETVILKDEKGHIVIRLIHHEGIIINRFAMEWHRGVYESYGKLTGARDIKIELITVDEKNCIYDFDITYKPVNIISRIFHIIIYNLPKIKELIENTDEIILANKEQILYRDQIIAERNQELLREKEKIESAQRILSNYIDPEIASKIFNGQVETVWKHNRQKLTLFFSDIKDFTPTTDFMEPEDMADLLNEYLTEMIEIVHNFRGTLAQISGDGLFGFFGAPEKGSDKENALRCAKMAINMQTKMHELQQKWHDNGIEHPFKIRCGLNTGMATVGSYGSKSRREYTAIGMQVNLASRIEQACEPGKILVSHSTWALIKDTIHCEDMQSIDVKGFHSPIKTYYIL